MSWKYVFNTNHAAVTWCGRDIDYAIEKIKPTGYKFFTWNGGVYNLHGEMIGITVEDLY